MRKSECLKSSPGQCSDRDDLGHTCLDNNGGPPRMPEDGESLHQ